MPAVKVNEIFHSVQGEGLQSGLAVIFIRLAGCNLNCSFCDTEHGRVNAYYKSSELNLLLNDIRNVNDVCRELVWTGGEPTLQLTDEIIDYFFQAGYRQSLETNGIISPPKHLDYISLSPKSNLKDVRKNYFAVNEIRVAVQDKDTIPAITELPQADNYYLSPVFDNNNLIQENLNYCLEYIRNNPIWKLSLQQHKLINIP